MLRAMQWLNLIACAVFATGCATLGGTRQYVSIDSEPRGLKLEHVDDGVELGQTPVFLHLKRRHDHVLSVRVADESPRQARLQCDYRWQGSGLGNLVLAAAGVTPPGALLLWGTAVGVDLATGAAWACPDTLTIHTDKPAPELETCAVYAVASPKHDDVSAAELVVKRWTSRLVRSKTCARVAPQQEVNELLSRFGFDHHTGVDVASVPRHRLNELGFRTKATHLVTFSVPGDGQAFEVTPTLHDLHSLESETDTPLAVDTFGVVSSNPVLRWLGRHVSLLPNAVAFAPSFKSFDFVPRGETTGTIGVEATGSGLPSVLVNWTVGWLEHPDRYGEWAANLGFGPGAYLGYNARTLTLPTAGEALTTDVSALHLIALYNGSLVFHTPAGALSATIGLGLGGAFHWEADAYQGAGLRGYAMVEAAWTGFVTERVFVKLAIVAYAPTSPELEGAGYALNGWSQTTLTVGWFMPGLRSQVRSLF